MAFEHVCGPVPPAFLRFPAPTKGLGVVSRARMAAERERSDGHGHGMSRNRTPKSDEGLPHDGDRREKQPYAREVEEYSGEGVAPPPDEQAEGRDEPGRPRRQ